MLKVSFRKRQRSCFPRKKRCMQCNIENAFYDGGLRILSKNLKRKGQVRARIAHKGLFGMQLVLLLSSHPSSPSHRARKLERSQRKPEGNLFDEPRELPVHFLKQQLSAESVQLTQLKTFATKSSLNIQTNDVYIIMFNNNAI